MRGGAAAIRVENVAAEALVSQYLPEVFALLIGLPRVSVSLSIPRTPNAQRDPNHEQR
jgi:hypothetical protein